KDLAGDVVAVGAEGDQVDVHGREHELDGGQDQDAVAPGQHAVDADTEQDGGEQQELVQIHLAALPRQFCRLRLPPKAAPSADSKKNGAEDEPASPVARSTASSPERSEASEGEIISPSVPRPRRPRGRPATGRTRPRRGSGTA